MLKRMVGFSTVKKSLLEATLNPGKVFFNPPIDEA